MLILYKIKFLRQFVIQTQAIKKTALNVIVLHKDYSLVMYEYLKILYAKIMN